MPPPISMAFGEMKVALEIADCTPVGLEVPDDATGRQCEVFSAIGRFKSEFALISIQRAFNQLSQ